MAWVDVETEPTTAGGATHGSWAAAHAKKLSVLSMRLEEALHGSKLLSLYAEWCDQPFPDVPSVAYIDVAYRYDPPTGEPLVRLQASERRLVYMSIPHRLRYMPGLGDPTLADAIKEVERFYSQTFWHNTPGLLCCYAALALAKRNQNINNVFFLLGSGGVGLSLTSAHLDAMMGGGEPPLLRPPGVSS